MGFGHRVYKSGDSRVPTMRKYFSKVAKIKKDKKFEKIYDIVEKVMIERSSKRGLSYWTDLSLDGF